MMAPKAPLAQCERCPARDGKFVPPEYANGAPKLVVVGEAPGRAEVEEGRLFFGPSGRLMMRHLHHHYIKRREVHWTNAILCDAHLPETMKEAHKCCAPRLEAELALLPLENGKTHLTVIATGPYGARSALRRTAPAPILKWRGSVSEVTYGEGAAGRAAWVLPTVHPAFVLRSPAWSHVLELDIARALRIREHGFTLPEEEPGRRLIVPHDWRQLEEALNLLQGEDEGFDVETVGLGPVTTSLVCFGLSDGTTTVVIPWAAKRDGSGNVWPEPAAVSRLISDRWRTRRVITHNGPAFDHIVARRYGLRIERWGDTLLAAHAREPHLPKNLAHTVTMGLDVPPWKQQEDRTADLPRLWVYNGRDALYMMLRWFQIKKEILP